jgi:hypothetical protein
MSWREKKAEYEGEVRRNGRVKEAIGRSRGMSGGFARGIADKVSFERWGAREKILFGTFCIYFSLRCISFDSSVFTFN